MLRKPVLNQLGKMRKIFLQPFNKLSLSAVFLFAHELPYNDLSFSNHYIIVHVHIILGMKRILIIWIEIWVWWRLQYTLLSKKKNQNWASQTNRSIFLRILQNKHKMILQNTGISLQKLIKKSWSLEIVKYFWLFVRRNKTGIFLIQ